MLRFAVVAAVKLALGLAGAALLAAALSAIASPHAGAPGYLAALVHRLSDYARLDFGVSQLTGFPVTEELGARLPATLALVGEGAVLAALVGLPLGLLFGLGPIRRASAPLMQIAAAAPVFCIGLALAWGAAHGLHWEIKADNIPHPPAGAALIVLGQDIRLIALPLLMVGLTGAAAVQLALRRAAGATSDEAYRVSLKRLGLSAIEIEWAYVIPQILSGLAAALGEIMLALLSAAVVAEWVFHCPGAADLFVKAVALGDWNLAALILFCFAALAYFAEYLGRMLAFAMAHREGGG
jgi:peptide/nickel transport system permease protein